MDHPHPNNLVAYIEQLLSEAGTIERVRVGQVDDEVIVQVTHSKKVVLLKIQAASEMPRDNEILVP